jgi:hypothetical protein
MYTVSDYRQTGMPVLAEVSTPEAGYDFAARMGFRESACVLPAETRHAPSAESVLRFNEMMTSARITHPHESFPGEQTFRALARAAGCDEEHEEARVLRALEHKRAGAPGYTHRNTVSQETA